MEPETQRRAHDLYAIYCASSNGLNFRGEPCPAWGDLTEAVRRNWYTVALRVGQVEIATHVVPTTDPPDAGVLGHLPDPAHALEVWQRYSGIEATP